MSAFHHFATSTMPVGIDPKRPGGSRPIADINQALVAERIGALAIEDHSEAFAHIRRALRAAVGDRRGLIAAASAPPTIPTA